MTWAPTETQKAVYETLSQDNGLSQLLGVTGQKLISFSILPTAGAFTLTYGTLVTGSLAFNASAATIQTALRLLSGLGSVTVAGTFAAGFTVTFTGATGELETLSVTTNTLTGAGLVSVTATVTTVAQDQKVFDHVPDSENFPYITVAAKPWTDRGNYTDEGLACELQVNVWYQPGKTATTGRGDLVVQGIQAAIDGLLHKQNICIEGWNIIALRRSFVDIQTDPDNVTKHGIQRFKLFLGGI